MTQEITSETDETLESIITWPNDGKDMIYIPGGSFTMGTNNGDASHQPEHEVYVADFYLDRWPVTNAEYKKFIDDTDYPVPDYNVSWCDTKIYNWDSEQRTYPIEKADHPVVLVSWEDAMAYAAWAGKRLLTEAEWERAARGIEGRRYPWGNAFTSGLCNSKEAELGQTSSVGHF